MATVQSFTKNRLIEIEETTIVSGSIDDDGNLQLINRRGERINAGYVVGPRGEVTYGTLTGTFLDLVGGAPRVNLDGVPFPITVNFSVVNPLLLKPNARVIILRMDEFYILAGQIGGTIAPEPNQVTDINVLVNETTWERKKTFVPKNRVILSWNPVLKDEHGKAVEIQDYQIWSRTANGEYRLDVVVDPKIQNGKVIGEVTHWEPEVPRYVVIYARSKFGRRSKPSVEYEVTPAKPPSEAPDYPKNVRVETNSGYFSDRGPMATIEIAFDPVALAADGGPITVKEYSLLIDGYEAARNRKNHFRLEIESGREFEIRVLAHSVSGIVGDSSESLRITANFPENPNLTPTGLTTKTGRGVSIAIWDGSYLEEDLSGAGRVDVLARVSQTEVWIKQGSLLSSGEQLVSVGKIGETVEVKLVAYDKLGRSMNESEVSTLVIDGFEIDESIYQDVELVKNKIVNFEEDLEKAKLDLENSQNQLDSARTGIEKIEQDLLNLAQKTGRVIRSKTEPSAEDQNEKNLWLNTQNGSLYQWDGTSWVEIVDSNVQDLLTKHRDLETSFKSLENIQKDLETKLLNAQSKVDEALERSTTANGKYTSSKNKPSHSDGKGLPVNAVWDYLQGRTVVSRYVWTGSYWDMVKIGRDFIGENAIGEAQIAEAAIGAAHIADASITTAKIGSLDIGDAKVIGTLNSDRIESRSISAEKLMITQWNLINNGAGEYGGLGGWTPKGDRITWDPDDAPQGYKGSFVAKKGTRSIPASGDPIDVVAGGEYLFEIWLKADIPGSIFWLQFLNTSNKNAGRSFPIPGVNSSINGSSGTYPVQKVEVPTEWTKMSCVWVVNPDVSTMRIATVYYNYSSGSETNAEVKIAGMRLTRRVNAELIVDGSITARKANFDEVWFNEMFGNEASIGRIHTNHLSPDVGSSLNISANESITLMVESIDEVSGQVSETNDKIDDVSSSLSEVTDRVSINEETINVVGLDVDKALSLSEKAMKKSERLDSYVKIESDGLGIYSKADSQNSIKVGFETIAIRNQGSVASYWDANRLVSKQILTNSIQIGANHVIESKTDRTSIRSL